MSLGPTSSSFDFGTRLGTFLIVESACLSALMVSCLLIYIIYSTLTFKRGSSPTSNVSTHIHYYFVNLLVFDLIQAVGWILDVKWVIEAGITEGPVCTAQGMIKQTGEVGVALSTLVIALYTFSVLVFRWHSETRSTLIVLSSMWTFIALVVGISLATHKGEYYYGRTQYWCWITSDYGVQRIALEYFWLWLAAFINIVCYAIIALVVKGIIIFNGLRPRFIGWRARRHNIVALSHDIIANPTVGDSTDASAIATRMLFYPLIYIVAVSPISVVRWLAFSGREVPFAATAFAGMTFSSSGVFNVILFTLTRPKLLPHRDRGVHRSKTLSFDSPRYHGSRRGLLTPDDIESPRFWKVTPVMFPTELPVLHEVATHSV